MKLREVVNRGNVEDLVIQYVKALADQDQQGVNDARAQLSAMLMGKGWDRQDTVRCINDLMAIGDLKDAYKVMAKWGLTRDEYANVTAESPIDRLNKFKASVTIPMVDKKNAKSEVRSMVSLFKRKGIQVVNPKIKVVASFKLPSTSDGKEEDDDVVDIEVQMIMKTKMERDNLYDAIEPEFELTSVDELDDHGKLIMR